MKIQESLDLRTRGKFNLKIIDAQGLVVAEREAPNIMCIAGLAIFGSAVNWSGIVDQAPANGWSGALSTLAPIYGALGTGNITSVSNADTTLAAEYARAVVSQYAISTPADPMIVTWTFFFGLPSAPTTITECGVFVNSTSTANAPSLLDHAIVTPVTQGVNQTALLQVSFSMGN